MKIQKKRWVQTGAVLICSLAVVLSVFPTFANDEIESLEGQSSALESELQGINQDILDLSEQISTTEMQVEILNGEIARTSDELAEAEANENQQYENMKSRIKYMYENGNATLLEMLFSAENMSDFLNKAEFIENLSEYDRNALNNLKEIHNQIAEQQKTLQTQQDSFSDLQTELESQKTELQAKADETSTNLQDVQNRLDQAKKEEAARIAAEEAAKEKAAKEAAERAAAEREAAATANNSSSTDSSYDDTIINNGSTSSNTDEVTLLAAIIQCEARQEYNSLLAVATVIMNRVESSRFPNSVNGVVYANGQFEPVWTGRLENVLKSGPTSLSLQVAKDAMNGSRLAAVADCFYFLYAENTDRDGVNIGGNLFFQSW